MARPPALVAYTLALLLVTLLATGCASVFAEGIAAVPTPTVTPTWTPYPTLTPLPTLTPTPTPPAAGVALPGTTSATSAAFCALPDLPYNQHISNTGSFSQSERDAAGFMVCRIERYSCEYQFLLGFNDPFIITKGEEASPFDEEDRMIHPDMLDPLTRLSQMVQEEWDGQVFLRVTDAYDSLLTDHDLNQPDPAKKVALHYEGRSIDLTTYPVNQALYGRLCALAHCAGFDWVHNEGDHCHASISAVSLCFKCQRR